ncbi:MAG: hypothetical protein GXN99_03080, partial [Candidatus Nanohaloarchaeota archaeon]|nr:hypothetical protein [Candidatus Nanohaloarchaeota archaeon]
MDFKKWKKRKVCLILHKHADLDALASAVAFQSYLQRKYNVKSSIYAKSLNSLSKYYAEENDVAVVLVKEEYLSCDIAVLIDTASLKQVGFTLKASKLYVIDHHAFNDVPADDAIIKRYSSTARVMYEIMRDVNAYEASHLIAGMLYDTGFLKYADIEDVKILAVLLEISKKQLSEYGFIQENILNVTKSLKPFLVKALKRAIMDEKEEVSYIITKVGSYESKIASLLLKLGFDLAVVVVSRKNEHGISIRMDDKVVKKRDPQHLLELLSAKNFQCGGHQNIFYCSCKG